MTTYDLFLSFPNQIHLFDTASAFTYRIQSASARLWRRSSTFAIQTGRSRSPAMDGIESRQLESPGVTWLGHEASPAKQPRETVSKDASAPLQSTSSNSDHVEDHVAAGSRFPRVENDLQSSPIVYSDVSRPSPEPVISTPETSRAEWDVGRGAEYEAGSTGLRTRSRVCTDDFGSNASSTRASPSRAPRRGNIPHGRRSVSDTQAVTKTSKKWPPRRGRRRTLPPLLLDDVEAGESTQMFRVAGGSMDNQNKTTTLPQSMFNPIPWPLPSAFTPLSPQPTSVRTRRTPFEIGEFIRKVIRKPSLQASSDGSGSVYIFRDEEKTHLLKIGCTADSISQRKKDIGSKCNVHLQDVFRIPSSYHKRVEKLVHIELTNFRSHTDCACGMRHREWFKISEQMARQAVERWAAFVVQDPWDEEDKLKPFWMRRINHTVTALNDSKLSDEQAAEILERFVRPTRLDYVAHRWYSTTPMFKRMRSDPWRLCAVGLPLVRLANPLLYWVLYACVLVAFLQQCWTD